jgi:hypothetical protein
MPDMFPRPVVLAAFGVAFAVTRMSDRAMVSVEEWRGMVRHVGIGLAGLMGVLGMVWCVEKEFLRDLSGIRRLGSRSGRRDKKKAW